MKQAIFTGHVVVEYDYEVPPSAPFTRVLVDGRPYPTWVDGVVDLVPQAFELLAHLDIPHTWDVHPSDPITDGDEPKFHFEAYPTEVEIEITFPDETQAARFKLGLADPAGWEFR